MICALIVLLSLTSISFTAGAANDNIPTPTITLPINNSTETPTPTVAPTISPRTVFSSPKWESDRISIVVNNNGGPIEVRAYIDNPSNLVIVPIDAGAVNKKVYTNPITAENGQIVNFGFKAYENGTLIDSKEAAITVIIGTTPTPVPPETSTLKGMVIDSTTKAPIVGAEVIFTSKTYGKQYPMVITDEFGSFTSPKMYPDYYSMVIKAQGYKPEYIDTNRLEGDQQLKDPLMIEKLAIVTPTPTPTPDPEADFFKSWITILTSPSACVAFVSSIVAVIVSLTVIYEWLQRQKERRLRDEKKQKEEGKAGEGDKKP
jgi:hypothetical protein